MQRSAMGLRVAACLAAASASTMLARADGLEAGLWRSVQTPTLNGMAGPPRETMRCLRDADVNDLDGRSARYTGPPTPRASRWSAIHAATPEMAPAVPRPARHGRGRGIRVRAARSLHRDHCRGLLHAREDHAGSAHPDRGRARRSVQVTTVRRSTARRYSRVRLPRAITAPVGWPVGEPPGGSSDTASVAAGA